MFNSLRLRLTLLFLVAAIGLLVLLGAGMYWLVARYFLATTDTALQYKMAFEFRQLGASLPSDLAAAANALAGQGETLPRGAADSSELAAIYVLPLDMRGAVLFNPNTFVPPGSPDQTAVAAALRTGSDRRTVVLSDGTRLRILTYRLTRSDGPALLQVGRTLRGQEDVLRRLLLGLAALACASVAVLGWSSYWLAGRSLRPAQEAWERQQAFIANASHEIRAPLTLLRASAEVAQRSGEPGDPRAELLADVIEETDHIARLVEDLLLLSRLDARKLALELEPLALTPFLEGLARQAGRLGAEHGIDVEVGPSAGMVWADPTYLRQVLLILVDNALRHTPPGGTIRLCAQQRGQNVELAVADTGVGIAPEHLPHLFERFYRVESSRGETRRGSGLGLSIAQALVEAQGGRLTVTSEPGAGTTVTILLPAPSLAHPAPTGRGKAEPQP
jgi:signal transduction histidine kinase